ncbi:MAG: hypothetical protein IT450_16535 [Phycisphaerales bacterium]|nr:hypothetical protein [Phycisphaerales bacterium]
MASRDRWNNARQLTVQVVASKLAPLLREMGYHRRGASFLRKRDDLWQFISIHNQRGRFINNDWSDQGWILIRADAASIALRRALGKYAVALAGFAADSKNPPLYPDVGTEIGVWDRGGPVDETLHEMRNALKSRVPAFFDGLTRDELARQARPGLARGVFSALLGDRKEGVRQCWNLWTGRANHGRFVTAILQSLRIVGRLGSKTALQLACGCDWRLQVEIILQTLARTNPEFEFSSSMVADEYYERITRQAAGNANGLSPTELREFIRARIEFDDDPEIYMIVDGAMYLRPELDAIMGSQGP